jgi:hypothetical protein
MAGGIGIAALASAAPAAAQYYPGYGNPGYGYGNPYGGNVVGQVLNSVAGGGYGNSYGGYGGVNSQAAVNQCASAVQARLRGGYGGGYGGYGYNGYASPYGQAGGGRVLGISRVEPRGNGGLTVRGVANSGHYAQAYGGQSQVDLIWRCRVDYRGYVSDVHIDRAQSNYGYNNGYTPYGNAYDYSQYGYRRY